MNNSHGRVQAVLFDFDGTLANTERDRIDSWEDVLTKRNIPFDKRKLREGIKRGDSNRQLLSQITKRNLSAQEEKDVLQDKDDWRITNVENIELFPEVKTVLAQVRDRGVQLAVYTGNLECVASRALDRHGCLCFVDHLSGRACKGAEGGKKERFDALLKRLELTAGSVLYIGDTEEDEKFARQENLQFRRVVRSVSPSGMSEGVLQSLRDTLDLLPRPEVSEAGSTDHARPNKTDDAQTDSAPTTEYNYLREEILRAQTTRIQVLAFTVAAVAVLTGLPFQSFAFGLFPVPDWLLFIATLVPYAILIPSALLVGRLCEVVTDVGAHIFVFHERAKGVTGFQVHKYRRDKRARRGQDKRRHSGASSRWYYVILYGMLGLITLTLSIATVIHCQADPLSNNVWLRAGFRLAETALGLSSDSLINLAQWELTTSADWSSSFWWMVGLNVVLFAGLCAALFLGIRPFYRQRYNAKLESLEGWLLVQQMEQGATRTPLPDLDEIQDELRRLGSRPRKKATDVDSGSL